MNRNSTIWLLLALIQGFYSLYIFYSGPHDSPWATITGVILGVGSLVSLGSFLRAYKSRG